MSYNRQEIQKEALDVALNNSRCTLAISMGVGKTYVGLQHMQKIHTPKSKFLVVAPKVTILDTWKEEASKFNLSYLLDHITFTTYLSLTKQETGSWDCIYLDECHSLLYSHEFFLLAHNGRILGLTGTAPQHEKSEKAKMIARFCPVKYSFGVEEATSSGILNDYRIVVHMIQLSKKFNVKIGKKSGGTWTTSEVDSYAYWTDRYNRAKDPWDSKQCSVMRMKMMQMFPSKEEYVLKMLTRIHDKCIVFANTKEQADKMCDHSYYSGNPDSKDNLEKFKKGEIIHLSSVLQLNEGVSIPNLKTGIIMHAYGNNRKSAQRIGRLMRLNPDDIATCHILCYRYTKDEQWVKDALAEFDNSKIFYYDPLTNIIKNINEYYSIPPKEA